jgi:vancomycin aglycone glucosyltransferase
MRVLLSTIGSRGDVQPLVALAWQLKALGTAHAPGRPTTDSLTRALEHTLQRRVAARAQSIATTVRSDGAHVAAQRLIIGDQKN